MLNNKKKTSIITPLYRGKTYLPGLLEMIVDNAKNAKDITDVEWIIVNDDPNETISSFENDSVKISIINHATNLGVQSSRIEGVENCNGEYVVMLDQDDLIMQNYLTSQLSEADKGDAVICRVKQDGRDIYESDYTFDDLFIRDKYLSNGNSIISPGQVLLKKTSIPLKEWKSRILKYSGADDHLLWLLMLSKGASFAPNDNVVFERIINMKNNCLDLESLYLSEFEVLDIVLSNGYYSDEEEQLLTNYKNEFVRSELNKYSKFNYIISTLNRILYTDNGEGFSEIVKEKLIEKHLAIYGGGVLCKTIITVLMNYGIKVECVVDRNNEAIEMPLPVVAPESIPKEIGLIIITVYKGADEIKRNLKSHYREMRVVLLSDLL